jgi:hypothetical protein
MEAVRVLIAAPFNEIGVLLNKLPIGDEARGLSVVWHTSDGATVFKYAEEMQASVVLLSPNVTNFDIDVVRRLSQHPLLVTGPSRSSARAQRATCLFLRPRRRSSNCWRWPRVSCRKPMRSAPAQRTSLK